MRNLLRSGLRKDVRVGLSGRPLDLNTLAGDPFTQQVDSITTQGEEITQRCTK